MSEIEKPNNFVDLFQQPLFRKNYSERTGAHGEFGLELLDTDLETVVMRVPYRVVTARTLNGPMHAGLIVTAMDSAMGLATMMHVPKPTSIATLELRYDEVRAPSPGVDIRVTATCHGVTNEISYLTGSAEDEQGIFAHSTGRFIMTGGVSHWFEFGEETS